MDPHRSAQLDRLTKLVDRILGESPTARVFAVDASLSDLGVTSIKMVDLMLAVEAEFDLTIPEAEINPENFFSIASLEQLVARLTR